MQVGFLDLKRQYQTIKPEIQDAMNAVLDSCAFASGPFVEKFETNFAAAHEARHCCAVSSGTAALHVALWAMGIGPGDEVIVPSNTFIATAEGVSLCGATPILVDCDPIFHNIATERLERAITIRTKVIIPVHLYGQPAPMAPVLEIAKRHNLLVLEDCAQSHLATYEGHPTGTLGMAGCFSFYPGKNIGAYGEGGAVLTNDADLDRKMRALRDHGSAKKYYHDYVGHNYRMEGLQGAVLDVKLKHLPAWTTARRQVAALYRKYLEGVPGLEVPREMPGATHSYHLYVVRVSKRDELGEFLKTKGIGTGIHYPIPCHLQKAYEHLGYRQGSLEVCEELAGRIISLPMHEGLTEDEIQYVAASVREFQSRGQR